MKNIKLMNKIAAIGTDRLDRAKYNVAEDIAKRRSTARTGIFG